MAIYDIYGNVLTTAFDIYGNVLTSAYDIDKNELLDDIVENRLLVWHDEFDGENVNSQKWEHLYGFYTFNRYYMFKNNLRNNAYCQDSILHINNKRDVSTPVTDWSGAFLWTNGIFEFRYGLVEAKIKFPDNPSYHSTIWTMGSGYKRICYEDAIANSSMGLRWPKCGEIDIAECDSGTVVSNKVWENSNGGTSYDQPNVVTNKGSKWHIYGMEWTNDIIYVYCDRRLVWTFNVNNANVGDYNAFRRSQFLILNQLPQGNTGAQTQNELETLVDWVRVYAPIGTTEIVLDESIEMNVNELTLTVGDRYFIDIAFTPENTTNMAIAWTSSNENVAVVYGGMITAISAGTTIITAMSKNGNVATCNVIIV